MKKLKSWIALILAVVLVGANVLYSMGSALQADVLETKEVTSTVDSANTPADTSGTNGLEITEVEQPPAQQPSTATEVPEPTAETPVDEASATETPTVEAPVDEAAAEVTHEVIIQKADMDGGSIKAGTAGAKNDVTYDGNNQYKEELAEGTAFHFEVTANDNYEIETVTDQNGTVISPTEVIGNISTFEIANVTEDKIISVLYKKTAAEKKARSAVSSANTAVSNDSYTVEYYMAESLKENYQFNGSGGHSREIKQSGRLVSFNVFFQYGNPSKYIKAVKMVILENVTGVDSNGKSIKFKAGEVVSFMDDGNAKPVEKLRTAKFSKDVVLKLDVQPLTHTVSFLEEDGTLIKSTTVIDGLTVEAPTAKELDHKKFTGWDTDFSKVEKDLTVKAEYEWTEFAVNYYLDEVLQDDYVLSKGGGTQYTTWIPVTERLTAFGVYLAKKGTEPVQYVKSVTMVMKNSVSGKSGSKDVTFEAGQIVSTFRDGNAFVIFGNGNLGHTNFDGSAQVNIIVKSLYGDNTFGVTSYDKAYDGTPHSITFTGEKNLANGEVVEYSLNGTDGWSQEKPVFTNVTDTNDSNGVPVYVRVRDGNVVIWNSSATVKITPAAITLMANANPSSKAYGDAEPDASAFTAQLTAGEFFGNDSLETLKYSVVRESGETAGKYVVTIVTASGDNPNYNITPVDGTFTITEQTLNIKPVNDSKTYGDNDPIFKVTINGVETDSSDTLWQELGITVTREIGEDARINGYDEPYALSVKTQDNKNYDIQTQKGEFFINKRPITITVGNYTKTYGDTDPQFKGTVDGWLEKDGELDYTIMREAGETVNDDGYRLNAVSTSSNNKNYETPELVSHSKLTILPKSVTLTPSDSNKIYGEPETVFGFKVTDSNGSPDKAAKRELDFTVAPVPNEGETEVKNVGNYTLQATEVTHNDNYSVNTEVGNYEITKRPVTVTANDTSKRYETEDRDANLRASVTAGIVVSGDKLFYTVERTSENQGEDVKEGGYQIDVLPIESENPNYDITTKPGTLTILPKETEVIITANNLSKTYGEQDPALTATVDGADADKIDYTVERQKGKNAGTYTTEIKLGNNPNYEHIEVVDGTFTITPKPIGITVSDETKIYGQKDPVDQYTVNETGLLFGDQKPTYTFRRQQGANVGRYDISAAIDTAKEENASNKNYVIDANSITNGTLTITPKDITVRADDSAKTYGDNDPAFTATADGVLKNDEGKLSYTFERKGKEAAGDHSINILSVTQGSIKNYTIAKQESGTLTIKKARAAITAADATKVYGDEDNASLSSVIYGGLVNGDTELNYTLGREEGETVGTYAISVKAEKNKNYEVETKDAKLTITPKELTVSANPETKVYGSDDPELTATVDESALAGNDQVSDIKYEVKRTDNGENVGTYPITVTSGDNHNYLLAVESGTLTISPKEATITAKDTDKISGETDPVLEADTAGTVAKDTLNYTVSREKTENSEEIGSYAITVTPGENPNYKVETENGEFAIFGKVTYDANGGSGEVTDTTKYARDEAITVKEQDRLTRENATFLGWSQQPYNLLETQQAQDEANSSIVKGITMGTENITLYAVWTQVTNDTAGTNATAATAPNAPTTPTPVTPTTIIQTITQPLTALADRAAEALNATVNEMVPVDEDGVPLANKVATDHKCCLIHLLLLLAALVVEISYIRSTKKRQKRIFALREEIALADKELKQQKDIEEIA